MNFSYSPGLFGYGVKGADGSAGIQGMGIYYTDYDLILDIDTITNRIQNNESLFSIDPAGTSLPGGRTYLNYEFIVDSQGNVCVITDASTGEYSDPPFARFATAEYFEDASAITSDVFFRYANMHSDPSFPYYIIDNVYNVKRDSYLTYPSKIYGISPKNFARVEFSNVDRNGLNPFSVYSSGKFRYIEDSKSIGIVRDMLNNTFRIGNYDEPYVRNVGIIFDVSSLRKNSKLITTNTPKGEIISNNDFDAQSLYTPIFNFSPTSFYISDSDASSMTISWNLSEITPDTSIIAHLTVFKNNLTAPVAPLIIHEIEASSSITLIDVSTDETYSYYISVIKDGWVRNTTRKQFTIGTTPVLAIIDPANASLYATTAGLIDGSASYEVDISTNSTSGWSLSNIPSWATCVPTSAITYSSNEHFVITVAANSGSPRNATITINSQASPATLYVSQGGYVAPKLVITTNGIWQQYLGGNCFPSDGTVFVTAGDGHRWYATASDPTWITISNGGTYSTPRVGNGAFHVRCRKTTGPDRSGHVIIQSLDGAKSAFVSVRQTETCPL